MPKDSSYEEEMNELAKEREAFTKVATQIGRKNTFNFLSDEGLLPNYAFPEAGIILKSILYRKKELNTEKENNKKKYDIISGEYNRSASSAISEFAPNNEFYVNGHVLKIDQVDLTTNQIEKWRLCPNCSHAELDGNDMANTSCPVCGSVGWSDSGQVRSMKKYFGNVDHLKACISDVPIENSPLKKQYLVIYDSVPGGTGYLKQLMQNENALIEVLENALKVLQECKCEDGCYHCLFAYRQSKNNGEISKKVGIDLLTNILKGKNNKKEISKISNISVNSLLESELEEKFVEVFKKLSTAETPIEIQSAIVNQKEGYLLKINDIMWEIEPQVTLDNKDNVSRKTKPDFVLWPMRKNTKHKPVAIYMDGFTYHKDKVDDDTLKRMAICKSGKFIVWSLCWNDILKYFKQVEEKSTDLLNYSSMPSGNLLFNKIVSAESKALNNVKDNTQLELLLEYLKNENNIDLLETYANAYAFSLLLMNKIQVEEKIIWLNNVMPILELEINKKADFDTNTCECCSTWMGIIGNM